MWTNKRHLKKERLRSFILLQEPDGRRSCPMRSMHFFWINKRLTRLIVPTQSCRVWILVRHLRPEPGLIVASLLCRLCFLSILSMEPIAAMLIADEMVIAVGIADRIVMILPYRSRIVTCLGHRARLLYRVRIGSNVRESQH